MKKGQSSGFSDKELYEKGRRLARDGRHKEAIEALNSVIDKNPLYAEAYFARGACHYALGNYQRAGEELDAAAILGCRDAQFWSKFAINTSKKSSDNQTK